VSAATAGTAGPRRLPRARLLAGLLIVSVALNLFFIGGAAWTRLHPPQGPRSFEDRFQSMAGDLGLNQQQRAAFDQYAAAMRKRREAMWRQVSPLFEAARQDMAKPQADEKEIFGLVDRASDKRRDFQRDAIASTLDFLSTLSADQRRRFIETIHERWSSRDRGR
jgi:uncharacterized membrane protein